VRTREEKNDAGCSDRCTPRPGYQDVLVQDDLAVELPRLAAGLIALILPLRLITRLIALVAAWLVLALTALTHTLIFPRRIWHDASPFLPDFGSCRVGG